MQTNTSKRTNKIVLSALMMCLIILATMFIRIPIPMTQGYVHLGDAMVFMSVLILGWKYGAVASGVGSALADIVLGGAIWAPWTVVVKGVMALIMGLFIERISRKGMSGKKGLFVEIVGMVLAGLFMVIGYYIAEGVIVGNWAVPLLGVPWNIGQFVVGGIIATIISTALYRTPARKVFEYRLETGNNK